MSQQDVMTWLSRAISELPMVITRPADRLDGIEYYVGEVRLGRINCQGFVFVDAGYELADMVVRNGWAVPDRDGSPDRLVIDLAGARSGAVALWLMCRNYRCAMVSTAPAASPDGATGHVSFDTLDAPPSIRMLDQVGTGSLRSRPPGP